FGTLLDELGDFAAAKASHTRAIALCREVGHQWGLAFCLSNLAQTCVHLNEMSAARAYLREGLQIAQNIQTLPLVLDMLTVYAHSRHTDAPALADELYALTLAHPLTEPETVQKLRAKQPHNQPVTSSPRSLEDIL